MKARKIKQAAFAAAVICIAAVSVQAHAQGAARGNGQQIPVPVANGNGNMMPMANMNGSAGFNNGFTGFNNGFGGFGNGFGFGNPIVPFFGGGASSLGQTFAVTPFGIQPLGYGYDGNIGSGYPAGPDWQMLQQIYAQAYSDALNTVAANNNPSTNQSGPENPTSMTAAPRAGNSPRVPHGEDGVKAWRVGGSQIALRWQGDSRIASSVTFEITDASGQPLRRTTVDQLPAEVRFTPPAKAAFYEVIVHYIDGASNTIMSRLPK